VAITQGPGPIRWSEGDASGELLPPQAQAIDTLGAGDIFHGAFCHAFAGGQDFRASLEAAAAVASRSTESWGPRGWMAQA
jgi:sugar/nucleoside kinase (ribokinase family)